MRDPDHVDTATRQRLEGDGHPAQITAYQAQKCAAILEARSAEAKALGIPMGYPWFKLEATATQHDLVAKSSNYELYGDLSSRSWRSCLGSRPGSRSIPLMKHS